MTDSPFDVAVIGAGVCGAAIARALSAYELRVALLRVYPQLAQEHTNH